MAYTSSLFRIRFRMMQRRNVRKCVVYPMPRKPKLGQNFLISPTAPRAIVDGLGDLSQATVLEIGPGKGVLTSLLAPRAKKVIAVELDPSLAASLQGSSVEVLCEDILAVDLTQLAT